MLGERGEVLVVAGEAHRVPGQEAVESGFGVAVEGEALAAADP
ncbi:hypothetical protein SAZ11_48065 [Streptomyces sp. FXJ1.4098]|nr:hypothetical protein [Streptomyces sp. FXJ1.4098]